MSDGGSVFQVSSTYLSSTLRALETVGTLDRVVMSRLGEEHREMIEHPHAKSWWPGLPTLEITTAVAEEHGPGKLEAAGYLAVKNGIGPIIAPMASVIGAIFGFTPSSFLSRMADLSSTSIRGVGIVWKERSPLRGTLVITYPVQVVRVGIEPLWRGAMRYIFDLSRTEGVVASVGGHGPVFELELEWKPKGTGAD